MISRLSQAALVVVVSLSVLLVTNIDLVRAQYSDEMLITDERCQQINDAELVQVQHQSQCSLCEMIVRNRYRWDWRKHPNALCTGVPRHLLSHVRAR
jgi:hypothetical protein